MGHGVSYGTKLVIKKYNFSGDTQKKDPLQEEVFEKYKHLAYIRFLTATRL